MAMAMSAAIAVSAAATSDAVTDLSRAMALWGIDEEVPATMTASAHEEEDRDASTVTVVAPEVAGQPILHPYVIQLFETDACKAFVAVLEGLRVFWATFGARFRDVWQGMDQPGRDRVLQVLAVGIPVRRGDANFGGVGQTRDVVLLCPEANLTELGSAADGVPAAIARLVDSGRSYLDLCVAEAELVRTVAAAFPSRLTPRDVCFLHEAEGPRLGTLIAQFDEAVGGGTALAQLLASGKVLEGHVWELLGARHEVWFTLLANVADAFCVHVFRQRLPNACAYCRTLAPPTATLPKCGRCRRAEYCNVGCQQAHWKQAHRAACRPRPPQ
jgi:hypothetical protein